MMDQVFMWLYEVMMATFGYGLAALFFLSPVIAVVYAVQRAREDSMRDRLMKDEIARRGL